MRDIAIVGMGCRFAGSPDPAAFWRLVREGRHTFRPVPADRWPAELYLGTSARDPDRTTAPHGAFLDDVRTFPALALGIPPRRVEVMDPQQRMSLEAAVEAIHDAGLVASDLPRQTGVYVGITAHEYRLFQATRVAAALMANGFFGQAVDPNVLAAAVDRTLPPRPFSAPGALGNMAAAIVAQELNLQGPAYALDAACASGMIALADAVDHLRNGRVDAALVGGAYLQLNPEHYVAFSRIGAMSSKGMCRPFDAQADGFVQGDGVGMVLLKRLDDALRDGDRVYAVVRGVGMNNDGRGDGPMAPSAEGQQGALTEAWTDAGIDPADATHVEAHGTGTAVGDVIELNALRSVLGGARRVALGSAKANVGHTMSTAGIAGLIKAVLSIHHGVIPPLANFETPKAELHLEDGPFWAPTTATPWDNPHRLTGVSSFGFGGTNVHAVLSAPPRPAPRATPAPRSAQRDGPQLILLSAGSEADLAAYAGNLAAALEDDLRIGPAAVARAVARRRRQAVRCGVVAQTREELLTALRALATGAELPRGVTLGTAEHAPNIAFLYPGQGSQRVGMLRDLRERFPVIDATLAELEADLAEDLPVPLRALLYPELRSTPVSASDASHQLTATEHCQPVLLACGVALTRLLASVGVTPAMTTGHSLGEFTAAAASGVLSPRQAATFVARRGQAMASIQGDTGAMVALRATREQVTPLLVEGAVIANENLPTQMVVSGATAAVDEIVARAEAAGIEAKRLTVSHAFHSPVLADLDVSPLVSALDVSDGHTPVISAIAGRAYTSAEDARSVFLRHATSPVIFTDALHACAAAGATLYLQVGAGGPLASFTRGTLPPDHLGAYTLAPMDDEDGGAGLLKTLGQLWCAGVDVDVLPITGAATLPHLPPAPLPREPYWVIQDRPTRPLKLQGATAVVRAEPAPEASPAPAAPAPAAADEDPILTGVIAVIAKVSAYPKANIRANLRLAEDLGFDSIMISDMARGLSDAFPGIGGIPQELLINAPTVGTIIDFVRGGGAALADHNDDAPLGAHRVSWTPNPLPDLPTAAVGPLHAAVTGRDAQAAATVAEALNRSGIPAHAVSLTDAGEQDASLIVWVGRAQPLAATAPAAEADPAGDLIAILDAHARRERTPHVAALHTTQDAWAGATAGALRAVAREWPDARIKHIAASTPEDAAAKLHHELHSADRTVTVRYEGEHRLTPSLTHVPPSPYAPAAGDVVLITGGTRGIGLQLGLRLAALGAGKVVLLGRSAPAGEEAAAVTAFPNLHVVQADVTDVEGLGAAVGGLGVTHLVHAAGVLADGPLGAVSAEDGARARAVKVGGLQAALAATKPTLRHAVAIGSWAGRFGSRHQAHYAAANAQLAALAEQLGVSLTVGEYGPWTGSDMASTIPAPVQAAMRAEGVDFVGPDAGLDALIDDLGQAPGALVRGRTLSSDLRHLEASLTLSPSADPFLADHAIDGAPILPLAGATDLMAWVAQVPAPFAVRDVTLFSGVVVREPVRLTLRCLAGRASLYASDRLAYTARIEPAGPVELPSPTEGGEAPTLPLSDFYGGVTFHGPLLQGITHIDSVLDGAIRGRLTAGNPRDWTPASPRNTFAADPLALDSAMQLAAYVAWTRFQRAGTPVSLAEVVVLQPTVPGEALHADVFFGDAEDDRFTATLVIRGADGSPRMLARDAVAELRKVDLPDAPDEAPFVAPPEATDPSLWPEVSEIKMRLEGVTAIGIDNPYFHVHQGTARDTTHVDDRELINFSSYNYVGLSGDPRVLAEVHAAVDRYGTSVSASRVASGERPFHGELEAELARAQDVEDTLVFTAGHATNVTTIGHLFGKEDLILHDELIHDSALQGIKLSGAARRGFRHEDPAHLEAQLRDLRRHYRRCLIIVEGVYSMDGDICDLPSFLALKKRYGCMLMVDEAHSFGTIGATGCGITEHWGISGSEVDLWMGTLSKSLASCGGWIGASKDLITYLRYTAPGFVYSAGLTPANGVAAVAALRLMLAEPERVRTLQNNATFFVEQLSGLGMDTGPAKGGSGVVPVITGNSMHALVLSQRLRDAGINVQPIVYPAVPDDAARLRFFLSSTHSRAQLAHTAERVAALLTEIREEYQI